MKKIFLFIFLFTFLVSISSINANLITTPIPEHYYFTDRYNYINTTYINFVVPQIAYHVMNPENNPDNYEIIIPSLSVPTASKEYTIKINFTDDKYIDDVVNINYTFMKGILNKSLIKIFSKNKNTDLKFNNVNYYLGTKTRTTYYLVNDSKNTTTYNISYSEYNWSPLNIDLGSNIDTIATDDTQIIACGAWINTPGNYYITGTLTCITGVNGINVNSSGVQFNGFNNVITCEDLSCSNSFYGIAMLGNFPRILFDLNISNVIVKNWNYGYYSYYNDNTKLENVTSSNASYGINLQYNNNTKVINSNFSNGKWTSGIYGITTYSDNLTLINVNVQNYTTGINSYYWPPVIYNSTIKNNGLADINWNTGSNIDTILYVYNTTYTKENMTISAFNGSIVRYWWYQALVTNAKDSLPVSGANVTLINRSSYIIGSGLTDTNGLTPIIPLIDYVANSSVTGYITRVYYSNYTAMVLNVNHSFNISVSQNYNLYSSLLPDPIIIGYLIGIINPTKCPIGVFPCNPLLNFLNSDNRIRIINQSSTSNNYFSNFTLNLSNVALTNITNNFNASQIINGTLTINSGNIINNGNLSVIGNLTVNNNVVFSSNLTVSRNLTVGLNAFIVGNLSILDQIIIGRNLTVGRSAYIAGNLTVGTNLFVNNNFTTKNELVIGNSTIGENLLVTKNLTVGWNEYISGNLTVNNEIYGSRIVINDPQSFPFVYINNVSHTPDTSGTYHFIGNVNGLPAYNRTDNLYSIYYSTGFGTYLLSPITGDESNPVTFYSSNGLLRGGYLDLSTNDFGFSVDTYNNLINNGTRFLDYTTTYGSYTDGCQNIIDDTGHRFCTVMTNVGYGGFAMDSFWDGAEWIATNTCATLFYKVPDGFSIYSDCGLTANSVWASQTQRLKILGSGGMLVASRQGVLPSDDGKSALIVNDGINATNISTTKLNVYGNANITGNLVILGNLSVKRPYLSATDNTTQSFLNTANTQVVTMNHIEDNWLVSIENKENITFQQTGDYQITFMPLFTVTSGSNKHIEFWIEQWNGTNWNQVIRSNTRIEIPNSGIETALSITYQVDCTPTTKVKVMWWSDSTNSQLLDIPIASLPTRPEVPSVILNVQKVSEITS